jgi:hypothetical protein
MDRSLKAALLSALVFPGVGQLFLKRPLRAMLFLLPALIAAVYFAGAVLDPMLAIARDILSGALEFDPLLIEQRVEASRIDSGMMNAAAAVMVVAWIASAVDAWLLGRAATPAPGQGPDGR